MKTVAQISESLRTIICQPTGGVVPLVDDLLAMCQAEGLSIDWQPSLLRARSNAGDICELDVPVPDSAFRAILARVAALCNARKPGSVSYYGGRGELSLNADPDAAFAVTFVNTTSEQRLELSPVPSRKSRVGPRRRISS